MSSSANCWAIFLLPSIITEALGLIRHDGWWRHQMETFSALLAICAGNSPAPGEFPAKGQWGGALMFSLIYVWINGWVNNRKAGDLRRYRAHYDVTVMNEKILNLHCWLEHHSELYVCLCLKPLVLYCHLIHNDIPLNTVYNNRRMK